MAAQLTGTVIAEKYRVESLLRNGELGDFYRGRHLFMDKPVTLKILSPTLAVDETIRDLFTSEAKNSSVFAHPNILAVNDFGAGRDDAYYIVYEGFDGEPLSQTISRGGQFSTDRALSISKQIAEALGAAHENGIVHGSLSPDSVLVSYSPTGEIVKVFDFEANTNGARRRADERPSISIAYLAPEQFSGLQNIDGRSDIYSVGIILFQMLTGEVPFKGETPMDVMLKHAEEPPPELKAFRPDCPASLGAAIEKALAKDTNERYQTTAELIEDLDRIAIEAAAPSGNRFWKTAPLALVGIAALAGGLIYATYTKQTIPTTQLQPDLNGVPVQPINPATGAEEQALVSVPGFLPGEAGNTNMSQPPGTLPGGDNYNPWATGAPPPGAPMPNYVPPGGQYYSIDPNTGSPFMPPDSGVVLVPVPANTDTAAKPTPTPKAAANVNTASTPPTKPAPDLKGTPVKEPPAPAKTPAKGTKPGGDSPVEPLN